MSRVNFFFFFLNVILTWVFARLSREFYLTYFRVDVGWMWMQGVDNPIGKLIGKEDGREREREKEDENKEIMKYPESMKITLVKTMCW